MLANLFSVCTSHSFFIQQGFDIDVAMRTKDTISVSAIVLFVAMLLAPSLARADSCAEKAAAIAKEQNAELLSARSEGDKCIIKMRIVGKDGKPPRIVEKKVDG